MCNNTHLPETVNLLETFLKAICESLFRSSFALLMMSVASTLISVEGTDKNQLEPAQ
jgi:hypothetical protein